MFEDVEPAPGCGTPGGLTAGTAPTVVEGSQRPVTIDLMVFALEDIQEHSPDRRGDGMLHRRLEELRCESIAEQNPLGRGLICARRRRASGSSGSTFATVGRGAETVYGPLTMCMCGPFDEMSESRKNGSGEDSSSDAFSPKSSSSSEEIYHWTPVGGDVPMDGGGAGIVYEYECKDGAGWTASLGALGPKAGISEPRGKSSGEDSTAAFRTGAASRGRVGAAGGEIRSTNKFISGAMLEKILYVI